MSDSAALPAIPARLQRFESLAYGLFLHWGLYSVHAVGEWRWQHRKIPRESYLDAFGRFDARDFDARALVRQAKAAGFRYICLTTRHHEGFSLFDTRGLNTFDAPHSPAKRDLVREFSDACEAEGMGKFFYHTTIDWWHPDFDAPGRWENYLQYLNDSVAVLAKNYGRVDGFWFDGNWWRKDRDWKEEALYEVVRRHQPDAIIVNNSSVGALGQVAHPMVDIATFEQGAPEAIVGLSERYLARERCETFNSHWGTSALDYSMKSPAEIIRILCECRRFGANLLLNVGPDAGGRLPVYESAALELIGRWIRTGGEAIYEGRPAAVLCRRDDFVLQGGGAYHYFAHELEITDNVHLHRGEPGRGLRTIQGPLPAIRSVAWSDTGEELVFQQDVARGLLTFDATAHGYGEQRVVRIARLKPAS
jgi:alpha-L-fucosidase